jgi:hypothetical protein
VSKTGDLMRAERTSLLDAPGSVVAELLFDPNTMVFVLWPLVVMKPVDPASLPPRWIAARYRVRMRLFGVIPLGSQDIVITDIEEDADTRRWSFHDAGGGGLAHRFDHHLLAEGLDDRRTRYTDRLDVEAGLLTRPIWVFARMLFAWRHYRWRLLIANKMRP